MVFSNEVCSTFTAMSLRTLLSVHVFQVKFVEKLRTHILCSITFLFSENRAVCEVMCENTVEPDSPQMTIRRVRIACWKTGYRHTHSEYVILIAFPHQQWLRERAPILRYTYIACLVNIRHSKQSAHAHLGRWR